MQAQRKGAKENRAHWKKSKKVSSLEAGQALQRMTIRRKGKNLRREAGSGALMEIKRYQGSTELLLRKLPFQRWVNNESNKHLVDYILTSIFYQVD